MQIPTRAVSTTGNTNTVTLSTTRSTTYTIISRNRGSVYNTSSYWTANSDGTYTLTGTLTDDEVHSIYLIEHVFITDVDVISYDTDISGNTIKYTIIANNNPSGFNVQFQYQAYAYRVNAYSYTYTFSDLPSDVNFTGLVTRAGTAYDSYSISGNSVTITWDSYYISDLSTIPTLTWTGYLTYESTKTYANVYFNGTLVDYVYFNGTRYPQ